MKLFFVLVAIFFSVGCSTQHVSTAQPYEASPLVGNWVGISHTKKEETTRWLIQRRPSGNYDVFFLVCNGKQPVTVQQESGIWEFDGINYITKTELLSNGFESWRPDTPDKIYLEEYILTSLTEKQFDYRHKHKEKVYTVNRVSDDFSLNCISSL